jgi:hypothetical protein
MLASCYSMLLRGRVLPIPVKSGTRNPAKSGRAEFREFGVSAGTARGRPGRRRLCTRRTGQLEPTAATAPRTATPGALRHPGRVFCGVYS